MASPPKVWTGLGPALPAPQSPSGSLPRMEAQSGHLADCHFCMFACSGKQFDCTDLWVYGLAFCSKCELSFAKQHNLQSRCPNDISVWRVVEPLQKQKNAQDPGKVRAPEASKIITPSPPHKCVGTLRARTNGIATTWMIPRRGFAPNDEFSISQLATPCMPFK